MAYVCVQPASSWARKTEDLTSDKTDDKDAVLIARLTAQLRCYLPEPVDETWGRLRHLGARREALLTEHTACVQQVRELLECVWPAALAAAKQLFKSTTWVAALTVIVLRDGGDLARTHRLGVDLGATPPPDNPSRPPRSTGFGDLLHLTDYRSQRPLRCSSTTRATTPFSTSATVLCCRMTVLFSGLPTFCTQSNCPAAERTSSACCGVSRCRRNGRRRPRGRSVHS